MATAGPGGRRTGRLLSARAAACGQLVFGRLLDHAVKTPGGWEWARGALTGLPIWMAVACVALRSDGPVFREARLVAVIEGALPRRLGRRRGVAAC